MNLDYVLLPRLQVQAANAQSAWWLINAAPVVAATLFAHNLGRQTGRFPVGVGIVHHDAQFLGEHFWSYRHLRFHPQQRRGSIFIDKHDYPQPRKGETQRPTLSLQPTATCHLNWSLLLAYADGGPSANKLNAFLSRARLAGGQIINHGKPQTLEDAEAVLKAVRSGYWLIERDDLMAEGDPLDALLRATTQRPAKKALSSEEEDEPALSSWIVPATLGYAPLTAFARRGGAREGYPHAYAEPLVGLVQYVSVHQYPGPRPPLWRHAWLDSDVFVVTQKEL